MKKYFIVSLMVCVSFMHSCWGETRPELSINTVFNDSAYEISVQNGSSLYYFKPNTRTALVSLLKIPFVSLGVSVKNMQKFVFEEGTYIPDNALKVDTSLGTFGIWHNEQGVLSCKFEKRARSQHSEKLMPSENLVHERAQKALKCLLLIDRTGKIHVQKITSLKAN